MTKLTDKKIYRGISYLFVEFMHDRQLFEYRFGCSGLTNKEVEKVKKIGKKIQTMFNKFNESLKKHSK